MQKKHKRRNRKNRKKENSIDMEDYDCSEKLYEESRNIENINSTCNEKITTSKSFLSIIKKLFGY